MSKNYKKKSSDFSLKKNTIKWIYRQHESWDFWFVDLENQDKWYYVYHINRLDALDWDEVLAQIKSFKWREEAVVKKVLKRTTKTLVWEFQAWKIEKNRIMYGFVVLKNISFKKDIFIAWKFIWNAKPWDIVWVKITSWSWKNPEWKIVEILWDKWNPKIDIDSFIVEEGFSLDFPNNLEKELKAKKYSNSLDYKKRKDLRNLFTFTIDWDDAKDLDDAISIEFIKDLDIFKLYVHIADVSHYVRDESSVDKEALKRWTSVYLVDRVLPMIPEIFSNNLCSLNLREDKLALTCEMTISNSWELKKTKIYETIIRSDYRLTYENVEKIISSNSKNILWDNDIRKSLEVFNKQINFEKEKIVSHINLCEKLRSLIEKNKSIFWVLNFDFAETKVEIDDFYNTKSIKHYKRYTSNKIIEEFMILANEAVSREFSRFPFLYRIHDNPKEDDIVVLQEKLDLFWVKFKFEKWNTKDFSNLLNIINTSFLNLSTKKVLEKIILRTLSKAIYSHENSGHFWLWIKYYSHFTSPIRRYPDLQIHRIIKEKLSWKLDKKRIIHYKNILKKIWEDCSNSERKAEKLEYKVRDYFIVKYYKDKISETFKWFITNIMPKWFFVELEDSAEWFVEFKNDFIFNDELLQCKNKKSWEIYKIGDPLNVKLIEADLDLIRLNFEIVDRV